MNDSLSQIIPSIRLDVLPKIPGIIWEKIIKDPK